MVLNQFWPTEAKQAFISHFRLYMKIEEKNGEEDEEGRES